MTSSTYGSTSGTDERRGREMMEQLLVYSLTDDIARLRAEDPFRDGERNSVTLAKEVDFRVVLSVLHDGANLHEEDGDARASIQVIDGNAVLRVDGAEAELTAGDLATIDAGHSWELLARGECAVLLTIAWPREKAGV